MGEQNPVPNAHKLRTGTGEAAWLALAWRAAREALAGGEATWFALASRAVDAT